MIGGPVWEEPWLGPWFPGAVDVCDTLLVSKEQESADGLKAEEPVLANARRTQAAFVG